MKKFKVRYREQAFFEIEVEAETASDAKSLVENYEFDDEPWNTDSWFDGIESVTEVKND